MNSTVKYMIYYISYEKNVEKAQKYHSENKESRNNRKKEKFMEKKAEELKQKQLKRAKVVEDGKSWNRKFNEKNRVYINCTHHIHFVTYFLVLVALGYPSHSNANLLF